MSSSGAFSGYQTSDEESEMGSPDVGGYDDTDKERLYGSG